MSNLLIHIQRVESTQAFLSGLVVKLYFTHSLRKNDPQHLKNCRQPISGTRGVNSSFEALVNNNDRRILISNMSVFCCGGVKPEHANSKLRKISVGSGGDQTHDQTLVRISSCFFLLDFHDCPGCLTALVTG